ncbi:MAG: hypothetical protein M3O32_22015 [Actinomycetota bacterium]|nr:hypothetical protein [Actinomycetota bacterium]
MIAAAGGTPWLAAGGLVLGLFGAVALLATAAAFLKGSARKAVADQRDQDIESQARSIALLKDRVSSLEAELAIAKKTIENMTSQIKSGEATQRLIETLERRLRAEGK